MRNVIFAINITLDGCCDHTKVTADDETLEYFRSSCERLTCKSSGAGPMN
jgi:hypothetical protein